MQTSKLHLPLGGLVLSVLLGANPVFAASGNATVGKVKSSACKRCHGTSGMSKNPKYPNLAGQQELYLIKALEDYKNGKRNDNTMRSVVSGMSSSTMDDLAAYYSSIKIKIKK